MSYKITCRPINVLRSWSRHRRVIVVRCSKVFDMLPAPNEVWPLNPATKANATLRGITCVLGDDDVLPTLSIAAIYTLEVIGCPELKPIADKIGYGEYMCFSILRLIGPPKLHDADVMHTSLPGLLKSKPVVSMIRKMKDSEDAPEKPLSEREYISLTNAVWHVYPTRPNVIYAFGRNWPLVAEHFLPPAVSAVSEWIRPSAACQMSIGELTSIAQLCAATTPQTIALELCASHPHIRLSKQAMMIRAHPELDTSLEMCASWFIDAFQKMLSYSASTLLRLDTTNLTNDQRRFWSRHVRMGCVISGPEDTFTVLPFSRDEDTIIKWVSDRPVSLIHYAGRPGERDMICSVATARYPDSTPVFLCPNGASTSLWGRAGYEALFWKDYDGPADESGLILILLDAHLFSLKDFAYLVRRHVNIIAAVGNYYTPGARRGAVFRDIFASKRDQRTFINDPCEVGVLSSDEYRTITHACFQKHREALPDPTYPHIPVVHELPRRSSDTLWIVPTNTYSDVIELLKTTMKTSRPQYELNLWAGHCHVLVEGEVRAVRKAFFRDLLDTDGMAKIPQLTTIVPRRSISLDEPGLWFLLDNTGVVDHRFCCNSTVPNLMSVDEHRTDCALATAITTSQAASVASESFKRVVLVGNGDSELVWDDVYHSCRIATEGVVQFQCAQDIEYSERRWGPRTDLKRRADLP